jgi:large subunit ribosomal protein L25
MRGACIPLTMTVLEIAERNATGGGLSQLRRSGVVPGVLYGGKEGSTAIQVPLVGLQTALKEGATHRPIMLKQGDKKQLALVKDVQRDLLTQFPVHVDMLAIAQDQPVRAEIPLQLNGADQIKKRGLLLMQQMTTIAVEALPQDLPEVIEIAIGNLPDDATLTVGDLLVPERVTFQSDGAQVVLSLTYPRVQAGPGDEAAAEPEPE